MFADFPKIFRELQVLLEPDNNNGYFTFRPMDIYDNVFLNSS